MLGVSQVAAQMVASWMVLSTIERERERTLLKVRVECRIYHNILLMKAWLTKETLNLIEKRMLLHRVLWYMDSDITLQPLIKYCLWVSLWQKARVKLSLILIKHPVMKIYGEVEMGLYKYDLRIWWNWIWRLWVLNKKNYKEIPNATKR